MQVPGEKGGATGNQFDKAALCTSCERDGDSNRADGFCQDCNEYLCKSCRKYHKKSKLSAAHTVIDASAMPKVKVSRVNKKPSGCTVPCPKHHDKMLEFLCQHHKVVLCYVCATTDHSGCGKDYIPDISEEFVKSPVAKAKVQRLKTITSYCTETESCAKDTENHFKLSYDNTLNDIEKFRNEINATLDKLQSTIKNEAEGVNKSNATSSTVIKETCTSIEKRVTTIHSRLEELQSTGQYDRFLVELHQADKSTQECEADLKKLHQTTLVSSVGFTKSEELHKYIQTAAGLGALSKCTLSPKRYTCDNEQTKKCVFERKIHIKMKEDGESCKITCMAEISGDRILLADFGNNAVKVLNAGTSTVTERLQLSYQPFQIAVLPDIRQAAVTTQLRRCIFLSTAGRLSEVRTIQTNGDCCGIAYARGKLIVAYDDINKYEILNLNGHVLYSSSSDLGLGRTLWHVAVSRDERTIFVADNDNNRVVKLTWDGDVVGEYKDSELLAPRAVVTCDDGTFYVCSRTSHTIHHVTSGCSKIGVMIKEGEIRKPQAMCTNSNGDKLFVTCWEYDDKYDNYLTVYKIE